SEPGRARDDALTLARELAGGPTRAYALIKEGLNASARLGLEETLELEAQLQKVAGSSSDHHEGVTAFLEKRRANFEGR
ncbi:enoyl-CoA hydratase-related protein, partial [Oceanithermus sp.]